MEGVRENPCWEDIQLQQYFVFDDNIGIVAWKESESKSPVEDIVYVNASAVIDIQVLYGSLRDRYIRLTREEYEQFYQERTTIYSQDNFWVRYGELLPCTEDDKKQWWEK